MEDEENWDTQEDQTDFADRNPFETALEYFSHTEKFEQVKFNVPCLDKLTEGGIDFGMVTEIFGEAGSGKSQICMQLALNVQLPREFGGLGGKAVYVSTDKNLAVKRLYEMGQRLKEKHINSPEVQEINFLDNILVEEFYDTLGLTVFLRRKLPRMLSVYSGISIVIIDSVAAIFRLECEYRKRASIMRTFVHELERLSGVHNFAILTTNHVTSVPQDWDTKDVAALGATWDTLVNTRIKVEITSQLAPSRVRIMEVIYSPRLPCASAKFIITSAGIEEICDFESQ